MRGMGLFMGVELMKERHSLEPAPEATARVFERCKELGHCSSLSHALAGLCPRHGSLCPACTV